MGNPAAPRPCEYCRVFQSQQICLSVYNTALLGLVNLVIQVFLADSAVVGQGASAFTLIGGTIFAVSVLFAPKVYKVSDDRSRSLGVFLPCLGRRNLESGKRPLFKDSTVVTILRC